MATQSDGLGSSAGSTSHLTTGADTLADRRGRLQILVVGALAALLVAGISGFVFQSRHDSRVNLVVTGLTELNGAVDYGAILDATAWPVTDPESGGAALYELLSIDTDGSSGPAVWAPGEVTVMGDSIVAQYEVASTGHDTCVVSVIRPNGNRVDALGGACGRAQWRPDLVAYINS